MVLKHYIRALRAALGFLILAFCFSCEEDEQVLNGITIVDCNECTTDEPLTATLEIKLERLKKYQPSDFNIYITIYEGNLEDDVVYSAFKTSYPETSATVPLNKKYTITARYFIHNKYYIAVNSVTPHVKYNKYSCDEPCYYIVDRLVNLKLKYTK
jgi:hypothetical protein